MITVSNVSLSFGGQLLSRTLTLNLQTATAMA